MKLSSYLSISVLVAVIIAAMAGPIYEVELLEKKHPLYVWKEVKVKIADMVKHNEMWAVESKRLPMAGTFIRNVSHYEMIVSLTSVSFRVQYAYKSIYSILNGIIRPSKIYLFLSKEPYLHDKGVPIIPDKILMMGYKGLLNIVYTNNFGPHRKLLPILANYFNDPKTLLVSIDDDVSYGDVDSSLVYQLFNTYILANGTSAVAARTRGFGLCKEHKEFYTNYHSWGISVKESVQGEMLVIPTGTKGVLYHPYFFHPVVFSKRFIDLTEIGDDISFRLSCMANHVPVAKACHEYDEAYKKVRNCTAADLKTLEVNSERHRLAIKDKKYDTNRSVIYKEKAVHKDEKVAVPNKAKRRLMDAADAAFEDGVESSSLDVNDGSSTHRRLVDLWKINVEKGNNDRQLRGAVKYVEDEGVIPSLGALLSQYFYERPAYCYEDRFSNFKSCGIFSCALNPDNSTDKVRILGDINLQVL